MNSYKNKKILIIGGTGTIGKGLVKELLNQGVDTIRIFSRDEYKQFVMQEEYTKEELKKLRFLIGDVRDCERVNRAMEDIDIVFNLAAMKHVPACEYNPGEAIKTNVKGIDNVIKNAMKHDVESVIFTSSDKAINPTNAYGATKLLAEKLMQSAQYSKGKCRTKFVAVRFGNVMGSRGSVIPLFEQLILQKGEINITDPTMSRFMMSLSDAVKLTLRAGEVSVGGEVFVLKMPVMNLKDLGEVVIDLVCKKFDLNAENIKMNVVGLRAGEKKYEELMTIDESLHAYDLGDMYAVLSPMNNSDYYDGHKKAKYGSYSSHDSECINKEEIRKIILSENLI